MKQFALFGLGAFGHRVALALTEIGGEVIAVDNNIALVENIKEQVAMAVCADCTDENALKSLGIEGVEAAIVALGNNQEVSILTTALLRDLGIGNILARATSELHRRILKRVGAGRVIFLEEQMAEQVAKNLAAPSVRERINLTEGHSVVELKSHINFAGKTILQINFRRNFNLLVVAIHRKKPRVTDEGEIVYKTETISLPGPHSRIKDGDTIIVVGQDSDIDNLIRYSLQEEER